jgi:tetratricopeptide (TPR) repeat protein/serine/threonine protein kinase
MSEPERQIMSLLGEAVEHSSPEARAAFLDKACAGDAGQRARVEELLRAHQAAGNFLQGNRPPAKPVATVDEPIREGPGTVIGPYKLLEQIGEGGFGVIFMAEQTDPVRRKVALKILKPGMDTRQVVARFEAERQALALMDHPNIAKVFDGGATASGRPYFVMELVKGMSITAFCDQHQLMPRQRLELFLSVCQAVQHAHQKGIIHRDLKPSNVLVSQDDTTPMVKVIDFGVAKALGQQLTDMTLFTGIAQMIGTPLYMSPEQAGMSNLDIDTRSDIYSLGVLLYELLTGTTPFTEESFQRAGYDEIRRIIREEEPPRPSTRLSDSKDSLPSISAQRHMEPAKLTTLVRGELDWIVMKALEKDRNRRYETANGFAQDIQRYLNDEPVLACPPSAWYRFRKFTRRKRTALVVTACLFLGLAATAGSIGWAVRDRAAREEGIELEQRARQARIANDLELALDRAELFQGQGKRAEALAALERVELLAGEAAPDRGHDKRLAALKERFAADKRDQEFLASFEDIRFQVQGQVDLERSVFLQGGLSEIREALRRYGIEVGLMPPVQVAARIQDRPEPVRGNLVAALGECLRLTSQGQAQTRQWLLDTLAAADNNAWRVRVRKAAADGDLKTLEQLVRDVNVEQQPPSFLLQVRHILPLGATRLELSRRTQRAHPTDLWANHSLAFDLCKCGQAAEAIRYYTAALVLRPENAGIYFNRAVALKDAGEVDAAIADYRQALALAPQYFGVHYQLCSVLKDKGQRDEAIAAFREAVRLKKDLGAGHLLLGLFLSENDQTDAAIAEYREAIRLNKDDWVAHNDLGKVLADKRQLDDAIAEYREAIGLKKDSAEVHNHLGIALRQKGQVDDAIAEFREAIRLNKEYPGPHTNLGTALYDKGQLDDAIAEYREAIRLKKENPVAHANLGIALSDKGQLDEAITEYKEAIRLEKDYAEAHNNLGNALKRKGQLDDAIAEYKEAIRLKKDYATAHTNLGTALSAKDQVDGAIAEHREAVRLNKDDPLAHTNLGNALSRKGQLDDAAIEYREAIRLKRDSYHAHNGLGTVLHAKNQLDDAITEFREALRLNKDFAWAHHNLGQALADKGQIEAAITEFREAIRLQKGFPRAHRSLGVLLANIGRLEDAIVEFREAIRLQKDDPHAHGNLGVVLRKKGKLKEAIGELRESIRLQKDVAEAHDALATVLKANGQMEEAIGEFREAIRLNKDYPDAHCNLGQALRRQGKFREALAELRRGHELGSKNPRWPYPSAQWVRQCEREVELDSKLPGFLADNTTPGGPDERIAVAELCILKGLNGAAVRFFKEAFVAQTKLADDLNASHRYNAACAAALAGCAQGEDAAKLDSKERARLRLQALDWLRADLEACRQRLDKGPDKARSLVVNKLRDWLGDPDFACMREPEALAKLPDSERRPWQELWGQVTETLARAEGMTAQKKLDGK